jgi:competence protein ComEA
MKSIFNLILGILIGLIMAGVLFLTVRAPVGKPVELMPSPTPAPMIVYVTGAVNRPGVYRLPLGSRLADAVVQAGGFMDSAVIAQVNLADKVLDGDRIVIPGAATIPTPVLTIGGNGILVTPTPPAGAPVNINTASVEELDALPGIGPTAAKAIVDYRTANGPFARVEDLLKIPGIGPTTLEQIRGVVVLGP